MYLHILYHRWRSLRQETGKECHLLTEEYEASVDKSHKNKTKQKQKETSKPRKPRHGSPGRNLGRTRNETKNTTPHWSHAARWPPLALAMSVLHPA